MSKAHPKEEVENIQEMAKKCREESENQNQGQSHQCKQFMIAGEEKEEAEDSAALFSLKTKIKSEQMEQVIAKARDQDVQEFIHQELENLGVGEEKRGEFLASLGINDPKEVLRELTKRRYDAERDALHKSIRERLEESTSKEAPLGEKLVSKVEEYKQLLHFNNVVSSFLKIELPDGEDIRNTTALKLEIQDNTFVQSENLEELAEIEAPWGHIDHTISQELKELGQSVGTVEDLPILSPEQVNRLLGGPGPSDAREHTP